MRHIGPEKNYIAGVEGRYAVANYTLTISFEYVYQFAFGMKMKWRAEIGNIPFHYHQLLLWRMTDMGKNWLNLIKVFVAGYKIRLKWCY